MVTCTKSRSVLHHVPSDWKDSLIEFSYGPDEESRRHLMIERESWEDMGSPTTLTVTIEPGDLLNEEG